LAPSRFVEFNGCGAPSLVLARSEFDEFNVCGAPSLVLAPSRCTVVVSVDEELGVLLVPGAGHGNSSTGKAMEGGVGGHDGVGGQ